MDYIECFRETVHEFMLDRQWNIEQFAQEIDCDRKAVSRWFEGKFYPRIESLIRISDKFLCSIDYLFGLTDETLFNPSPTPSDFFTRYNFLRNQQNITDYAIAKACGIGNSAISKWKRYKRIPNTETLIKLTELFSCSIEYLIGRSDSN